MTNILFAVLEIEAYLFILGFFYGLARGNEKTHWLVRSLGSGLFFTLFYIFIPILEIFYNRR